MFVPSFPTKVYKSKSFTSKLSCFVVPQVGCSSLPVDPTGTLELSAAICGDSTGEIKIGCGSVVGGAETLQVVGTPVSNSSESLPSVLVPTTEQVRRKIDYAQIVEISFDLRNVFLSHSVSSKELRLDLYAFGSFCLSRRTIISGDRFITY